FVILSLLGSSVTPSMAGDGAGFFSAARSKWSGMRKETEYNHVEQLALCLDKLEEELLEDGAVVAKAPDIWGEARLTRHRQEFERKLAERLDGFNVRFNANIARSDQAFLASAIAVQSNLAAGATSAPSGDLTQINNLLPGVILNPTEEANTGATTFSVYSTKPGNLFDQSSFGLDDAKVNIEPTIELDQLARYLNHLHEIRRMNEGDDTSDSPGYSLNLVRIPISLLPGSKTRKGYGAEITVTAEAHVTDELLPTTFRQLVINDLVDQLSVPIYSMIRFESEKESALQDAFLSTKRLWQRVAPTLVSIYPQIDLEGKWLTREKFDDVVKGLDERFSPRQVADDLEFLSRLVQKHDAGNTSITTAETNRLKTIVDELISQVRRVFPDEYNTVRALAIQQVAAVPGGLKGLNPVLEKQISNVLQPAGLSTEALTRTLSSDPAMQILTDQALSARIAKEYSSAGHASAKNDALNAAWTQILQTLASGGEMAERTLGSYRAVNMAYTSGAGTASAQRRARSPLSGQNLQDTLGRVRTEEIAKLFAKSVNGNDQSLPSALRGVLRDELETAYDATFHDTLFGKQSLEVFETAILTGAGIEGLRNNIDQQFAQASVATSSMRALLAWPIIVESVLLNKQLNDDIQHVSKDPECHCMAPGYQLPFYGTNPPPEARQAFVEYVKCRWPIHVFALDPMAQEQNIADQYSMRREMQLAMALAFANGSTNAQNATRYMRRLEMDMETVALNRTAVAFGHGNDTFGWRFTPRVQTPDFESNTTTGFRDLLLGGPNRDDLRKDWELEAGMKECVAIVLMPSFVTHIRFDCRGHFYPLTCGRLGIKTPSDARTSVYDNVEMSRMVRQMQDCAVCAFNESHLYRDGEVDRLLRRVKQLEKRLPLQTSYSRVPNENTLGGFEMFSSGVTDLAPELYDFYGEPGFEPGTESRFFLVGGNFSVTGTRVIAGNREAEFDLLSREVMEIVIPADAVPTDGHDGKSSIDIHVATPYGVSPHVHIPLREVEPVVKKGPVWSASLQEVLYRWTTTQNGGSVVGWEVSNDKVMVKRPHEIRIALPSGAVNLPVKAKLDWTASIDAGDNISDSDKVIVNSSSVVDIPYDAASGEYVVDSSKLQTLHFALKDGLVQKLKALGDKKGPPSDDPVTVLVTGKLTLTVDSREQTLPVGGVLKLNVYFPDQPD
ncbi:MAG: hypothetical protein KDA91_06325, partial [Planctomycetaceae bacterium]|nr:hypothetical protein [Planctomycetaceae bacterium]